MFSGLSAVFTEVIRGMGMAVSYINFCFKNIEYDDQAAVYSKRRIMVYTASSSMTAKQRILKCGITVFW